MFYCMFLTLYKSFGHIHTQIYGKLLKFPSIYIAILPYTFLYYNIHDIAYESSKDSSHSCRGAVAGTVYALLTSGKGSSSASWFKGHSGRKPSKQEDSDSPLESNGEATCNESNACVFLFEHVLYLTSSLRSSSFFWLRTYRS